MKKLLSIFVVVTVLILGGLGADSICAEQKREVVQTITARIEANAARYEACVAKSPKDSPGANQCSVMGQVLREESTFLRMEYKLQK